MLSLTILPQIVPPLLDINVEQQFGPQFQLPFEFGGILFRNGFWLRDVRRSSRFVLFHLAQCALSFKKRKAGSVAPNDAGPPIAIESAPDAHL